MAIVERPGGASTPSGADEALARAGRWWAGPWGRQLLVELATIVGVYLAYKQVRFLVRDHHVEAFANAGRVIRWEEALGLFTELGVQDLVLRSGAAIAAFNRYYVSVHFPLTVVLIVWAYVRHRETAYARLRFFLLTTTLVALVIHVAFPLAPPRMLPQLGFVDTLAEFGPRIYPSDPSASVANQFAAMPSLHVGWALVLACCLGPSLRRRWAIVLWAHPVTTVVAVTATANHFWLDSIVAAGLVVAAQVAWHWRTTTHAAPSPAVTLTGP